MKKFFAMIGRKLRRLGRRIYHGFGELGRSQRILVMVSLIFIVASLLLGTVFGAITAAKNAENERKRELALPYEIERISLERELVAFEAMLSGPIPNGSTLTTVIIGADAEIYTNILPLYRDANAIIKSDFEAANGITYGENGEPIVPLDEDGEDALPEPPKMIATVCLSPEDLPGMEGKMTRAQLGELLAEGWTTAVYVTADDALRLDEYLTEMRAAYAELELEWTDSAVFACRAYDAQLSPILASHEITNSVDTVYEGEGILSTDLDSDIWCVKADGWSLSEAKGSAIDNFNTLTSSSGAMVFLIEVWHGAKREGPTHLIPYTKDEASLGRMLKKFGESVTLGELAVDTLSSAKQRYSAYYEIYTTRKEIYEPRYQEVSARLREVKDVLHEIYAG